MNGRQALNLQPGDRVVRGPLGGKVTSKTRMFVAIRWDDGTVTSIHRHDMESINRPGTVTEPKAPRVPRGPQRKKIDEERLMRQWLSRPEEPRPKKRKPRDRGA